MTELHIDKQQVILPKDFSLTIIEENPVFTKNGKYTYDLELSLDNDQNAKIYKHLNRINNKISIPENRSAYLVVDNEVVLNGTEIILEITDRAVKIQLVSGESELNFLKGGNKKINELELGDIDISNLEFINYAPLLSNTLGRIINGTRVAMPTDNHYEYKSFPSLPQPYFWNIINRILESLGYSVSSNVFRSDNLKYLYIVNGIQTKKYKRILPDWTVNDFFTEVENLFNVIFLVNEYNRTVSVVFKNNFYQNREQINIKEILDEHVQEVEVENSSENIGYDLPGSINYMPYPDFYYAPNYFEYQNLDKTILENTTIIQLNNYNAIKTYINANDKSELKDKLFLSISTETYYICYKGKTSGGSDSYFPKKVNIFKPIINNGKSPNIDIKLKITPAQMTPTLIQVRDRINLPINPKWNGLAQMPIIETSDFSNYEDQEDNAMDIQEFIEEGESGIEGGIALGISLAFFDGNKTMKEFSGTLGFQCEYPMAWIDFLTEIYSNVDGDYFMSNGTSLRLDYLLSQNSQSIQTDTTRPYHFKFIYKKKIDAKSIFIFNNKKFVCKDFKRTIDAKSNQDIIEGIFYAVD